MSIHKNAAIICQWVNGASIQGQERWGDEWVDVPDVDDLDYENNYLKPSPIHPDYDHWENWRVKMEVAPKVEVAPTETACNHSFKFLYPGSGKYDVYKCTTCGKEETRRW